MYFNNIIFLQFIILFLGLWAVINTADVCLKGRIEMQESIQWETLFKTNVFGTLKAARTFYPLLVSQKGKQI
jgi:NADP-dependent 3-hydroxy acid dehydrogenase YdfG